MVHIALYPPPGRRGEGDVPPCSGGGVPSNGLSPDGGARGEVAHAESTARMMIVDVIRDRQYLEECTWPRAKPVCAPGFPCADSPRYRTVTGCRTRVADHATSRTVSCRDQANRGRTCWAYRKRRPSFPPREIRSHPPSLHVAGRRFYHEEDPGSAPQPRSTGAYTAGYARV